MGSKCAPSVACLYMADFEERYVYPYATQPLLWKRYIDDIFIIWTHGDTALNAFVSYLNWGKSPNLERPLNWTSVISLLLYVINNFLLLCRKDCALKSSQLYQDGGAFKEDDTYGKQTKFLVSNHVISDHYQKRYHVMVCVHGAFMDMFLQSTFCLKCFNIYRFALWFPSNTRCQLV